MSSSQNIIVGPYTPLGDVDETISISQFMMKYNPDNVPADKVVHADSDGRKILTYGGLRKEAARCAAGFRQKLGLKDGDVVTVMLHNCSDFVSLTHAAWWAGAVISPINTSSTTKDISAALNIARPKYIATAVPFLESIREAIEHSDLESTLPMIITVCERAEGLPLFPDDIDAGMDGEKFASVDLGRSAKKVPAVICFSSGTTGCNKGILLSHHNIIANCLQFRLSLPMISNASNSEVSFASYSHMSAFTTVVVNAMWFGRFTCSLPSFSVEVFCQKIMQYKATLAHIMRPVALLLAHSEEVVEYNLDSLNYIIVTGSALKAALPHELATRFPRAHIYQTYGLSECSSGVIISATANVPASGTIGFPLSATEVRLVDPETGIDVRDGEEGELLVRGPQVMMRYVGNEEATKSAFLGDWLRTGDIMRRDEKGTFWLTDRYRELIKYKCFRISPSEIEALLLQHIYVDDAAVCATYNDALATEVPVAYVSLKMPPANADLQCLLSEIHAWSDSKLVDYKKLRGGIFHLWPIPKSYNGGILRRMLPARLKGARTSTF